MFRVHPWALCGAVSFCLTKGFKVFVLLFHSFQRRSSFIVLVCVGVCYMAVCVSRHIEINVGGGFRYPLALPYHFPLYFATPNPLSLRFSIVRIFLLIVARCLRFSLGLPTCDFPPLFIAVPGKLRHGLGIPLRPTLPLGL